MSPSSTSSSDQGPLGDAREVPDEVLRDRRFRVPPGERVGIRTAPAVGGHRRRKALWSLAVVVAVLVLAELTFRVLPPLPAPIRWDDVETQYKEHEMIGRQSKGARTPVVYLGSSIIDAAVDPTIVARGWSAGRHGYNAALEGMDGRSIAAWARYIVRPRVGPRVVVIGLSPRELNDNGANQASFDASFFGSRGWREARGTTTWSDRATDFGERHSALIRSRTRIRDPYNALLYWRTGSAPAWTTPNVPSTGRITQFDAGPYEPPQLLARRTVFNRYHVGGRQVVALRAAIADLQRGGVEVVLVEPAQVTADLRFVTGQRVLIEAQAAIEELATSSCSPLVDLRDAVPDRADFDDEVHVAKAGSALESRVLGDRLAALRPDTLRPGC